MHYLCDNYLTTEGFGTIRTDNVSEIVLAIHHSTILYLSNSLYYCYFSPFAIIVSHKSTKQV